MWKPPRFLEKDKRGGLARHHGIDGRVRRDRGLEFAGRGWDGKVAVCPPERATAEEFHFRRKRGGKRRCNGSLELVRTVFQI